MKKLSIICLPVMVLLLIACGGKDAAGSSKLAAKEATAVNGGGSSSAPAAAASNKKGKLIYKQYCVACHGMDGKLAVSGAKDLSISELSIEERIEQVTNGKGLMTPYKDILSAAQIEAVCEYVAELRK